MTDFSVFDSILDTIFVINGDGKIQYCNDAAATFCETSVRRVTGKAMLIDVIQFAVPNLLPFTVDSQGRTAPTPFIETAFIIPKTGKAGKVQLAVRPIDEAHWGIFIKDVSLEETLAEKYRLELAKTEAHARNLEALVEERTVELRKVNQTLKAILDSLGQGFFTFDAKGVCGTVFTKACEVVLEGTPKERTAWEMLGVPENEVAQFHKWMETTFSELLPFDDLKVLGPSVYTHSQNRRIELEYYPIRLEDHSISQIVVVATDKSAEFKANLELEEERQFASMVVRYLKNKDQFLQFLQSVRTAIVRLGELYKTDSDAESTQEAYRVLHTIEGEAGTFSLRDLRQQSRDVQGGLELFKTKTKLTVEDKTKYYESIAKLSASFEEFLLKNESIFQLPKPGESRLVELPVNEIECFQRDLEQVPSASKLASRYQELFMMVPIETRLKYFDGLMQAVAENLGKKVHPLIIRGGELKIFPEPYQAIFSSMVHAFRNAIDHGLEEPTEREWGGKDPAGTISVEVSSTPQGGLKLVIRDDGQGISPEIIRKKLIEKFPDRDFSAQNDEEIIQNVCLPGFSSRDSVGEYSGRGVGLDALREEVLNIGGTISLKSKVGEGTAIEIFLPKLGLKSELLRSA